MLCLRDGRSEEFPSHSRSSGVRRASEGSLLSAKELGLCLTKV